MVVECTDTTLSLNERELVHVSTWEDSRVPPGRVVFLIHGLMMHGRSFERLGELLAADGAIVVAPDLRGFGRSYYKSEEKSRIDYLKSLEDLSGIIRDLKEKHSSLPLFCVGESLGAHLARRVVSAHPELVSGLILASPCVRPRMVSIPLIPHAWSELVLSGMDPQREFNLSPFAKEFLKQEDYNLQHFLEDPLTRKSLEILELIDSIRVSGLIESAIIPEEIPILVLRGKNDCVCKLSSAKKFLESLNQKNMTVHSCDGCGHIILQAKEIEDSILKVLKEWLEKTGN